MAHTVHMKTRVLAVAVLVLAAPASGAEIPPGLAPEPPRAVLSQTAGSGIQGSSLDPVERRELERQGPGSQGGRPLTKEEKTWCVLGAVLLGVLLVASL